ncbi:2,3,4,5-tetrahydropyridine-2,6-dicarboxylate N-succinyltransferase (plasmid) [Rhizobium laguerreae]|uniref:2,3,4,5-tetrahydropyridine-2-carboxylate N-succinyltransferase n=2 Tax=Rhizobium laguerreae TaxID=1076926 RepID=A0ABR6GJ83_9HYPH|nr:DapH/DapD/GlmU-related protein [Rhizobium laguerreae]MBB3166356.1 2,3,4,5-tetrahydropyridine-2-carboxylate N-succinyltransferase [Rhizobium laguerreae]OOO43252.1 hypothetical protein BS630_29860 [Rhizobium laguerreae]UFW67020.1 2,3,4,5-tetrahydropyridine-2,6-dicarboxylate N-succinyltransferase [Rhizobium laguerreae]
MLHQDHNKNALRGVTAMGLATVDANGRFIEARYLKIGLDDVDQTLTERVDENDLSQFLGRSVFGITRYDDRRDVHIIPIQTTIRDLQEQSVSLCDVYLRLHLLSSRVATPGQVNLAGVLDFFVNVAWTSLGPCLPERVEGLRHNAWLDGREVTIGGVWPFPRMTDYVVPCGVKIMNSENVRLGAYLANGTNVLGGGFCNTGSSTLGATAVEGRLSLGVTVGEGSHIGGGASLMGTTSGGGKQIVNIGRNCLVGANAGVGISLGDNCIVEAGCYVTAGLPVHLADGRIVKASDLAGKSDLLFRRDAFRGIVEAVPSPGWSGLNMKLHQ